MEKLKEFFGRLKWSLTHFRTFAYSRYAKHLLSPKRSKWEQISMIVWRWIHERLMGNFLIKTRFGTIGLWWHGFFNFDFYLGRFCRLTINKNQKMFLIGFMENSYDGLRIYHQWLFGHTVSSVYDEWKLIGYRSEWHWGRYRPHAPKANIVRTGKLLGIGYGERLPKEPVFSFNHPFSPIISAYIENNGWYVCSCGEENTCPGNKCEYALSERVVIPCRPRRFLQPGDIIIFFEHQGDDSDRFLEISSEDIEEWKAGERSLLPNGVVVRIPQEFSSISLITT
jgi:hypothetical protein